MGSGVVGYFEKSVVGYFENSGPFFSFEFAAFPSLLIEIHAILIHYCRKAKAAAAGRV